MDKNKFGVGELVYRWGFDRVKVLGVVVSVRERELNTARRMREIDILWGGGEVKTSYVIEPVRKGEEVMLGEPNLKYVYRVSE